MRHFRIVQCAKKQHRQSELAIAAQPLEWPGQGSAGWAGGRGQGAGGMLQRSVCYVVCCNYFIIFPFPAGELQQAGRQTGNYSILSGAAGVANCSSSGTKCRGVKRAQKNLVGEEGQRGGKAMKTFALHVAHTHTHKRAGGNASAWKNFATAVCMYSYVCMRECVFVCVLLLLGVACYVHECR